MKCIFCNIVLENENLLFKDKCISVFEDIKPEAKLHLLIVPNIHYENLIHMSIDEQINFFEHAMAYINSLNLDAFKIEINNGKSAGQIISHLHLHLKSFL